ncbi:MFS transporter [Streptomyces sp. NPDC060035]|uniref:MFS transporter n=1 Tax=Streptomyces sp. NPDC060035 TaxID=3347044 RepID=UPI0036CD35EA
MKDLPSNARYCVLLEPLWALTGTVVLYYATLYMKTVGLSNLSIGVILSANLYAAFLCQIIAGAVTDRLGRRMTSLVFDLIGWVLPMVLWAIAGDFWIFLVAALFNACGSIVNTSFSLLATEDTPEPDQPRVFAAIKLVAMGAGLLTPVAGVLMDRHGVVPTLRIIYAVGAVMMFVLFVWRHRLTEETAAGKAAMKQRGSVGMRHSLATNLRLFWQLSRQRRMWPLIGLYIVTSLAVTINVFQVIYLAEVLAIGAGTISWIPALAAAVALLCFLVLPRLRERSAVSTARAALVLCAAGWLLFLFVPKQGVVLLLLSSTLTAAGVFLTESYRDTLVVSTLDDNGRAAMFGALQSVATMMAIPSGYVAALLYNARPQMLFVVIFLLYTAGAVFAWVLKPTSASSGNAPLNSSEQVWSGA